jgi:hypothetical protein
MAFIVLRKSRNTRSYLLIETYRDAEGKSRKRTLCYLGREQDGTDTLEKALTHWRKQRQQTKLKLPGTKGPNRLVLRRRLEAIESRMALISEQIERGHGDLETQ